MKNIVDKTELSGITEYTEPDENANPDNSLDLERSLASIALYETGQENEDHSDVVYARRKNELDPTSLGTHH